MTDREMITKIVHSNYRIEVTAARQWRGGSVTDKQIRADLEEIRAEIKRHVDNVDHCGVYWDTDHVCPFCGEPKEGAVDEMGVPWCCGAQQEVFSAPMREDAQLAGAMPADIRFAGHMDFIREYEGVL